MTDVFRAIWGYFLNYISQYSFFISWDYYANLFKKYFSVAGFIIGFIFVLIIIGSSAEGQKKTAFLKIVPIIAAINGCYVLNQFFYSLFRIENQYVGGDSILYASDNIISGIILTLVVISCYKEYGKQAFWFGVATHIALPLLNFSYLFQINGFETCMLLLRVVLTGLVCLIISHREYFFTSWIWYFGCYILVRSIRFAILSLMTMSSEAANGTFQIFWGHMKQYYSLMKFDLIVFVVILIFSIIYEKIVLDV